MTLPSASEYVPGYLTSVTINGKLLDGFAAQGTLTLQRGIGSKPAFGAAHINKVGLASEASLQVQGWCSESIAEDLWTAWQSETFAYVFETKPGAAGNVKYTGNGVCENYVPIEARADGDVQFSMQLQGQDLPTPTFPGP